ncbi:MAG: TlpA family protein disulfide reductase [Planctomycetes bacterium]|nr:TlpA family protein disulfide reductase [Planctomycetota bacterium]
MSHVSLLCRAVVALGVVGAISACRTSVESGGGSGAPDDDGDAMLNEPAPDVERPGLDGKPVKLSDFRGRIVLLDFWATWCGPCREEIPHLAEISRKHAGDLVVVGVSDEKTETVTRFRDAHSVPYVLLKGRSRDYGPVFAGNAIPRLYVIDRDGIVRQRLVGYHDRARIEAAFKPYLTATASPPS